MNGGQWAAALRLPWAHLYLAPVWGCFCPQVVVQLSEDLLSQAVMMVENSRPTLAINLSGARQYWLEGMLRHEIGQHGGAERRPSPSEGRALSLSDPIRPLGHSSGPEHMPRPRTHTHLLLLPSPVSSLISSLTSADSGNKADTGPTKAASPTVGLGEG